MGHDNMTISNKILSDIAVHMKYARYLDSEQRRETWEENVTRNKDMHVRKFPKHENVIEGIYDFVYDKKVLPSMRSAQYGGKPIEISPNRIYNCCYLPIDDFHAFSEVMFLLLGGTGVGYSVQDHHVEKLPPISRPSTYEDKEGKVKFKKRRFLISDTIEGWADAVKVLMRAFLDTDKKTLPVFDFRDIRPKGARLVTSGGKAPGPEPLKACLNNLEAYLRTLPEGHHLTPIEVHDFVCEIAQSVLVGGIRRAALISLFSKDDEDMLRAKSNFNIVEYEHVVEKTKVSDDGVREPVYQIHEDARGNKYYDLDVVVDEPYYGKREVRCFWVSEDDLTMLEENGRLPWYHFRPNRGRSNNSAVLNRETITQSEFLRIWDIVRDGNAGEPGFYFTDNEDWGTNPCAEISLRPFQFCNLTEVNTSNIEDQQDLNERVAAAAKLGTLQASYTDFHYLRPIWKEITEKGALIGVGMTGIASNKLKDLDLKEAAVLAKQANAEMAELLGINKAARVTTVKPSGTSSLVLGCSSGIHGWHAPYYIRRMRVDKKEAIYQYLMINHPDMVEDELYSPNGAVISVPQKAPDNAIYRDEPALSLLERVKRFNVNWVQEGHRSGDNTNNVSCTVSIRDDEWEEVGEWMWHNRDTYNGIAVLPFDGGTYQQAPFEEITESEYKMLMADLEAIDLTKVIEIDDNTDLQGEVACAGPTGCEVT